MTIVEFMEICPCHNIISTVGFMPERVLYIGDTKIIPLLRPLYDAYFRRYHPTVTVIFREVDTANLDATVHALCAVIEEFPDAQFDITGGDDIVLMALGIVTERYRERRFGIHRFHIAHSTARDMLSGTALSLPQTPTIRVEQAIALCGGTVSGSPEGGALADWDLTGDLGNTVDRIWSITREDPHRWNKAITGLNRLEKAAVIGNDPTTVFIPKHAIDQDKAWFSHTAYMLSALHEQGVVTYRAEDDGWHIRYGSADVKRCLSKAGNALEYKTLRLIQNAKEENGSPFFSDARCGVYIDWDSRFSDASAGKVTVNEIDVVATRGVVPWFISCKNGTVDSEELYKFTVVSRRFGGRYAKTILVATYVDRNPVVRERLLQRAADMRILLIDRVHERCDDDWTEAMIALAK